MKIKFELHYHTSFGEELYLLGDVDALGNNNSDRALKMNYVKDGIWTIQVAIPKKSSIFTYEYIVKRGDDVVRKTSLKYHFEKIDHKDNYLISDRWLDIPLNKPFFSSAFTESFFAREHVENKETKLVADRVLRLIVCAPTVPPVCDLALVGDGELFGNWQIQNALKFEDTHFPYWTIEFDLDKVISGIEYKLVMIKKGSSEVVKWEEGENRRVTLGNCAFKNYCYVINIPDFRDYTPGVRYAGTAIPVFSLRSESSFGIGDFGDLYKFVDWVKLTDQSIIQILPINDTTMTHTWVDSYPYNANSIYALHPAYIDLSQLPAIKDPLMAMEYKRTQPELNALAEVDYDRVTELKWAFLKQIFKESGKQITDSKEYKTWFDANKEWLESYAAFSYLRDIFHTPVFTTWKKMSVYKQKEIDELVSPDSPVYDQIALYYFIQYELHKQLLRVRNYAHAKGVILKGDIPIGISRNSVEAWKEPYLFNMFSQAGAPPDDFSANGQNWGFPTYNWDEMKRTNYAWWKKRFAKMADYFDAYRIDHLLGFFRIWEIPMDSVQGLLGHFNPALPYSRAELEKFGFYMDDERHLEPYIRGHFLHEFFGIYTQEVIDTYLNEVSPDVYKLKVHCDTQRKIESLLQGELDEKLLCIRDGLFALCNEVLFVRDPKEKDKFHPRISAQFTKSFQELEFWLKDSFNSLYNEFFYNRHNSFWEAQAMEKLPPIIESTNMLVCVEDLGMIPDCVPHVIDVLQVLALEIQRMPKDPQLQFGLTNQYPYLSVCTTSTHDMAPIREWWHENGAVTQDYYNHILWQDGKAPIECSPYIAGLIVNNHLKSPAMLTILPLQDWMAIDDKVRKTDALSERINVPAIAKHYWRYRMHLSIEELMKCSGFNETIRTMILSSGRYID